MNSQLFIELSKILGLIFLYFVLCFFAVAGITAFVVVTLRIMGVIS